MMRQTILQCNCSIVPMQTVRDRVRKTADGVVTGAQDSTLRTALERVARTELAGSGTRCRNRLRCGCRLGPRLICLRATIAFSGKSDAARNPQRLAQTLQGFLPNPALDSGIPRRCATVPGRLRSRAARLRHRRERGRVPGRGHRLFTALGRSFGDVLGKRHGSRCWLRCVAASTAAFSVKIAV